MKNDDEMYMSVLSRYEAYMKKKQKRLHAVRFATPFLACFAVAFGLVYLTNVNKVPAVPVQQDITGELSDIITSMVSPDGTETSSEQSHTVTSTTATVSAASTASTTDNLTKPVKQTAVTTLPSDVTDSTNQDSPTAAEKLPQVTTAAVTEPTQPGMIQTTVPVTVPPASEPPVEDPPGHSDEPGNPGAVLTNLYVTYDEAKTRFGYPIVPCASSDFLGYNVGIVSQHGNVNSEKAFCLSVNYEYAGGYINITDENRLFGDTSISGDIYEYSGRVFGVEELWGSLHVSYASPRNSGIVYQAIFSADSDMYQIMDKIISIEF